MNRGAPISNRKLFALVATLASLVALCGPATELVGHWYSGSDYIAFSVPSGWAFEQVVAVGLGVRIGYAVALSAMLVGGWLLLQPRAEKILGRRYLLAGALLGAIIYVGSQLLTAV